MAWVENVLTHLSRQGHRVTEPRRIIMGRIVRYTQPFGTEQLYQLSYQYYYASAEPQLVIFIN
jgi:hypothetical protein